MSFLVPKKSESADVDDTKIGNEEGEQEESFVVPSSPLSVDKKPLLVKSPKVCITHGPLF